MSRPFLLLLVLLAPSVDARPPSVKGGAYRYDPDSIPQNEQILRLFLHLAAHTANRLIYLKNEARSEKGNQSTAVATKLEGREGLADDRAFPNQPSVRLFDGAENLNNDEGTRPSDVTEKSDVPFNRTSGNDGVRAFNVTKSNEFDPAAGEADQALPSHQPNVNNSNVSQTSDVEESKRVNDGDDSQRELANFAQVKKDSTAKQAFVDEPQQKEVENPEHKQGHGSLPKKLSASSSGEGQEASSMEKRMDLFQGVGGLFSIPRQVGEAVVSIAQPDKIIDTINSGLKTLTSSANENVHAGGKGGNVREDRMEVAGRLFFIQDEPGGENSGVERKLADSAARETASLKGSPAPIPTGLPADGAGAENVPKVRSFQGQVSGAVGTLLSPISVAPKIVTDAGSSSSSSSGKVGTIVPLGSQPVSRHDASEISETNVETLNAPREQPHGAGESNTRIKASDENQRVSQTNSSASHQKSLSSTTENNLQEAMQEITKYVPTLNEPKSMIPLFRAFPDVESAQDVEESPISSKTTQEKEKPAAPDTSGQANRSHAASIAPFSENNRVEKQHETAEKCVDRSKLGTPRQDQLPTENFAIELSDSLPFNGRVLLDDELNGSISESALKEISDRLLTILSSADKERVESDLDKSTLSSPSNLSESLSR